MRFHLGEKVYIRARNGAHVDHRTQTVVRIDTYRRFAGRPVKVRYYAVAPLGESVPEEDLYRDEGASRPAVSNESSSSRRISGRSKQLSMEPSDSTPKNRG